MRLFRQRSFFVAIFLFWFFSSLPRLWYFLSEGGEAASFLVPVKVIAVGFLQDGVLIAFLLLIFQLVHSHIFRWPVNVINSFHTLFVLFWAGVLALLAANVEFFRFFGSNSNSTHLALFFGSKSIWLSLKEIFTPVKIIFSFVALPLAYVVLCKTIRGWRVGHIFLTPKALFFPSLILLAGYLAFQFGRNHDPLQRNLESNYILSFLKYYFSGDEISGLVQEPIEKILDSRPSEEWHYFDPKFPLVQATEHQLCQMGKWNDVDCNRDADGDGFPLRTDCQDKNAIVHPGAVDRPGNGVDEDCSGMDASPPNIILIHWEGVRAVNVGSLGYDDSLTPRFDALSKKGRLYRNAYANGTQTRWSLTSVYNSILPRLSTKWIFKHNPELRMLAFPKVLRDFGYETIYVHSGDTNFGELKPRLSDWFEKLYDRRNSPLSESPSLGWGPRDEDLYKFSFELLKARREKRPLFMTIATLSLHHPFLQPGSKFNRFPHASMANRYKNILGYCDEQLVNFVEKVLSDPELKDTLFLITSDHGMNMGEPHPTMSQSTLWEDLVWVPLLLVGKGWNVPMGVDDDICQLADIGPTILDRLGIQIPNHFIGRSLLRSRPNNKVFFGNANGGISAGLRFGNDKYVYHFQRHRDQFYDMGGDRREKYNLNEQSELQEKRRSYRQWITDTYIQSTQLIRENRIWRNDYTQVSKGPIKERR